MLCTKCLSGREMDMIKLDQRGKLSGKLSGCAATGGGADSAGKKPVRLSLIKTESSPLEVLGKTPKTWFQSSTYTMAAGDAEQGAQPPSEQSPLLADGLDNECSKPEGKVTTTIWTVLAGVFAVGLILVFTLPVKDWDEPFPSPERILKSAPVIDGHIGQFVPHVYHPQRLGLSYVYLRACHQTCPNSFGCSTRTTCPRSISTSQCWGTSIYQD